MGDLARSDRPEHILSDLDRALGVSGMNAVYRIGFGVGFIGFIGRSLALLDS